MDEPYGNPGRFNVSRYAIAGWSLLAVGLSFGIFKVFNHKAESYLVEEQREQLIEGVGEVVSRKQQVLIAETEAFVVSISPAGEQVQPGQVLAVLKSESLERSLVNARRDQRAFLNQSRIKLNDLESRRLELVSRLLEIRHRLESQRQRVELIKPLVENGAISRFEFENEGLKRGELEAQLSAISDQVDLINRRILLENEDVSEQEAGFHAAVRELEGDLEALTIRAPFEGRWTDVAVVVGERVAAGSTLGKLVDESRAFYSAQVPERHLAILSTGQSAEVNVAGRTVDGQVARINPTVSGGLFRAEIHFAGDTHWKEGQTGSYRIRLPLDEPHYWVSARLGAEAYTSTEVWIERDGERIRRTIQIGARHGDRLKVLTGATAGDRLSMTN